MIFFHETVLINETVEKLNIVRNGVYVDATLGGGGLSYEILNKLENSGKLISIDVDPDSISYCRERFKNFKNIEIVNDNFVNIDRILHNLDIESVNGIVMDLGVSSHQIDCVDRGFSYIHDAPLDMRMSKSGVSAYEIVNFMEEKELSDLIWEYGEEKFSKSIARKICLYRKNKKIESTVELSNVIKKAIPKFVKGNPSKKTFQAIRIAVNNELENLEISLDKCIKLLKKNGRLIVLSFHSLEDRIVKNKMKFWSKECVCDENAPICTCNKKKEVEIITKKAIIPTEKEICKNSRSKSAKLRVCQKI